MKQREVNFSKSDTGKGMNHPETVDYYNEVFSNSGFIFHRTAKRALQLKDDAQVIADVGTGPGFLAIELAKQSGKKVKALDIAPNMLKKADENAKKAEADIELIEGDCFSLPFDDHSVDLVTSSSLIHMLDDPKPFFKELKRVVKPEGRALITGFKRNPWWIFRKVADYHTNVMCKGKPIEGMAAVLNASFTQEEIENMLKEVGLNNYKVFASFVRLETVIGFESDNETKA